jgi:hypothetical protein
LIGFRLEREQSDDLKDRSTLEASSWNPGFYDIAFGTGHERGSPGNLFGQHEIHVISDHKGLLRTAKADQDFFPPGLSPQHSNSLWDISPRKKVSRSVQSLSFTKTAIK